MIQPNPAYELRSSGWFSNADGSGPYSMSSTGVMTLIGAGGGGAGGDASAANQVTGNASLASIDGKTPALGAAASAAAVPVVLATNDAQIGTKITAVSALPAGGTGLIGWLSRVWQAFQDQLPASLGAKTAAASLSVAPATDALFVANTLAAAGVARQLAAAVSGGTSANTALTTTCRRISITARLSDIRYAIGSASQTASATTHFIAMGERLDLAVPATPNIAVLSATTTAGVLEVTELT